MFGRVGGCVRYPKLFYPKGVFLLVMVCFGDSVFFCLNVWMSVFFWNVFWCGLVSVFFCRVGGGLVSVNAAITHCRYFLVQVV